MTADACKIVADHFALKVALLVTGINGYVDDGILIHQVNCRLDGRKRGFTQCGNGLIPSGQPTEVEHSRFDRFLNVIFDVVMRIVNEGIVFGATDLTQMLCG